MRIAGLTFLTAFALSTLVWTDAASACSCPKETMIKKYGTVAAPDRPPPAPPASEKSG